MSVLRGGLDPETRAILISAARRAARTFLQAFAAQMLLTVAPGNVLDLAALKAAAVAGVIAVLSFAHRALLDPSPFPSLADVPPEAIVGVQKP